MSPETTAQLALAVSSALALWQLLKHVLEGGRVRVRMRAGLHDEYVLRHGGSWSDLIKSNKHYGGWPLEVAVIEVENLGRTAVTVSEVALDLGRPARWRLRRHTVGPHPMKAPDARTEETFRLEPFDRATYVFDVWRVLAPAWGDDAPARPLRLRGSVRVAGKRFRRRSPWRKGWRVTPGQVSFLPGGAEVGLTTYRALWRRAVDDPMGRVSSIDVALAVRERFPAVGPAPSEEELLQVLEEKYLGENRADAQARSGRDVPRLGALLPTDRWLRAQSASHAPSSDGGPSGRRPVRRIQSSTSARFQMVLPTSTAAGSGKSGLDASWWARWRLRPSMRAISVKPTRWCVTASAYLTIIRGHSTLRRPLDSHQSGPARCCSTATGP